MGKHKHKKAEEKPEEESTPATEESAPATEECAPATEEGVNEGEAMETKLSRPPTEDSKSYEELVGLVNVIANPLASKKLTRKLYKAVRKSQTSKRLKRGVREVVKAIRKNEKGVVVLAGDVSPIDVISHIPVFCEDKSLPYCYVPSRKDLGSAGGTKRPTSVVLIQSGEPYEDLYEEIHGLVDALPLPL